MKAIKKIDLWKLPSILMITFKRFKYTSTEKIKILSPIEFEADFFDLSSYVPKGLQK